MFGTNNFMKGSKGMGKMFKLMMLKEMMGGMLGGSRNSGSDNPLASMLPMMMMGNMFSGNKDGGLDDFSEMFDLDFDGEDEEDKPTDDKKAAE
jgi:hypothetical protein